MFVINMIDYRIIKYIDNKFGIVSSALRIPRDSLWCLSGKKGYREVFISVLFTSSPNNYRKNV